MDEQRFDAALRALHTATTRRKGLAAALGLLLGGMALDADARGNQGRGPAAQGPCGDGSARANRCQRNGDCCTKYCADGECRCKPNWMQCGKAAECCSGVCSNGRCDGGAKPAGSRCEESFNCQDGLACIKGVCTKSNTARCTKQNCPGCCEGTTCRSGSQKQACGTKGGACARCSGGATCTNGICGAGCSRATCPDGCCKNGVCKTGTSSNACGSGGGACVTCTGDKTCQSQRCKSAGGGGGGGGGCTSDSQCSGSTPICDGGTCRAAWSYSTQFGTQGSGDSNLRDPLGLAISADTLTTWVADYNNNRIVIWTRPDASSTTWSYNAQFGTAGIGDSGLNLPSGIAVSPDTLTAWVADYNNKRIVIWTRQDASSTTWSYSTRFGSQGSGDAFFTGPTGIAVSADTLTVWVADPSNYRIAVWTRPDTSSTSWSHSTNFGTQGSGDTNFSLPRAIAVSEDTLTVWVADYNNNRIVIWTRPDSSSTAWSYSTQFGTFGTGATNFKEPKGIAVSPDTLTAWVGDSGNHRIMVWKRPDASSTTWTSYTEFGKQGSDDTSFSFPFGVAVSPDTLTTWVVDNGNNRISIWTQS